MRPIKNSYFFLITGILGAILFNTFIGFGIATAAELNPGYCAAAVNGVALLPTAFKIIAPMCGYTIDLERFNHLLGTGHLLAGLNREIWLAELMQKFRADVSWLKEARDLAAYVMNNMINLADAGADPGVIVDYDGVDPIPVADTEDTPIAIGLKRFSTERDRISAALQAERNYSIRADRTQRHVMTLEQAILLYSAIQFAPAADGEMTPLFGTSGTTVNNFKNLKNNDVIDLSTRFNVANANNGTKILVLHPTHFGHLQKEDVDLFKNFTPEQLQQGFPLHGFKTYISTATPTYNYDTLAKKAYAAVAAGTDTIASFAFLAGEVGRAKGEMYAFTKEADPTYQSDEINFMVRFIASAMRNKGIGAIYSTHA